jgi:predicted DNA-binding transcriptional regulator AlpA
VLEVSPTGGIGSILAGSLKILLSCLVMGRALWWLSASMSCTGYARTPLLECGLPTRRSCPNLVIAGRAHKARRNGLDKQLTEYPNCDREAENNIIARSLSDARGDVENLLARLRYDQGRSSTPWTVGEEFPRFTSRGPKAQKKLLDIKELEEIYGLKHWTIRTLCSQRKIPHLKLGRRVFFDPAAIDAWLQEHVRPVKEVDIP